MKIHIILFDFGKKNVEGKPGPGRREKNTREFKKNREGNKGYNKKKYFKVNLKGWEEEEMEKNAFSNF